MIQYKLKRTNNFNFLSNMNLYISGRVISLLGTQIYNFILALYILKMTGTALTFAITLVLSVIPRVILSPFAGVLVDNMNRKKIIVLSDIISGFIMLFLYIQLTFYSPNIYILYSTTLILNMINTFFDISMTASITDIFNKEEIMKISSLSETITSATSISGPLLGGFIFGLVSFKWFILFNGISFFLSAFLEMLLTFNSTNSNKKKARKNIWAEIKESIDYIHTEKIVGILYFAAIFINIFFAMGVTITIPYIVNNILNLNSYQFGILQASTPVGMFIASIILSSIKEKEKKYTWFISGLFVESFCMILLGLFGMYFSSSNISLLFFIYALILFLLGSAISVVNINIRVVMQKIIPNEIKGKVFGTLSTFCMIVNPLTLVLSGFFIDKINPFILPSIAGFMFVILTFILSRNKYIKTL